ncbi:MAG TPA: anti-sigma F factor antagonist [Treponema sp.]|nr:anti-sigma F factor antagonist [Treponema sp.]
MEARIWTNQLIHIIDISGGISLADANKLKNLVMKLLEKKAERFIINAQGITSIDSSGIGAIIFISSTLKNLHLPLAITNLSEQVQQTIDKTKLSGYFQIYGNLRDAIRALSQE